MESFHIKSNCSGKRLDKFIFDEITKNNTELNISRNTIKNHIKNGFLKKNGVIFYNQSYIVNELDNFEIVVNYNNNEIKAENIKLDIIYEDEYLSVINKQSGLSTHPGAGDDKYTLANALVNLYGKNLSDIGGKDRPGIIHRLDKDTSGLLVIAKNNFIHNTLKEQLENRELKRTYNAVIWGNIIPYNGYIEGSISRHKTNRLKMILSDSGRYSKTNYKTLEKYSDIASLVECKLDTGRTHQIRVHFSTKKHPIIGDKLYGGNTKKISNKTIIKQEDKDFIENFPRQALHSKSISFTHPITNKQQLFETELPNDIKKLINILSTLQFII